MRRTITACAGLTLAASLAGAGSPATERDGIGGARRVWRAPLDRPALVFRQHRLELEPVSVRELAAVLHMPAAAQGLATGGGATHAKALSAPRIQRRIDDAWTVRVPRSGTDTADIDVTARVVAVNGNDHRLASAVDPSSEIEARVVPLPPRIIARDGDAEIYGGSLLVELDLSHASLSGSYRGTLFITVNQF